MRILLTGHKGFIGSKLLKELEKDNEMFFSEDIMNDNLPDVDLVYHLAGKVNPGRSITDPFWDMENISMGLKIATQYKDKRIIYTSSDATLEPFLYAYGISKKASEDYIRFYCKDAVIIITPPIGELNVDKYVRFLLEAKDYNSGTYNF